MRKVLRIEGRGPVTGNLMLDDILRPGSVKTNHRRPARHRFDQRLAEGVHPRGRNEHIRSTVSHAQGVRFAQISEARTLHAQRIEVAVNGPAKHDDVHVLLPETLECFQKKIEALVETGHILRADQDNVLRVVQTQGLPGRFLRHWGERLSIDVVTDSRYLILAK